MVDDYESSDEVIFSVRLKLDIGDITNMGNNVVSGIYARNYRECLLHRY